MKKFLILPFTTIVMTAVLAGCGHGKKETPVPRPVAYPRVASPSEKYVKLHGMNISTDAEIVTDSLLEDGSRWITLSYPKYSAMVYISRINTYPDKVGAIIRNRTERMELNTGGNRSELVSFEAPTYESQILKTPRNCAHPVQLLAVARDGRTVLTAVAELTDPAAVSNPDSIAPVVEVLNADISALLPK